MEEGDQTAQSHCRYVVKILDIFGQPGHRIKFLAGDNCSTNQATAMQLGVPLVGCASLRFNLATGQYLREYDVEGAAVTGLMTALRTPNNRAEFRCHSNLAPVRLCATRWSSTFEMIERYMRTRDEIKMVDAVFDLNPKGSVHRRIEELYEEMKTFNSVCKKLQQETISLADVRVLFDSMCTKFPATREHLRPSANIVHAPAFESAVVKVFALIFFLFFTIQRYNVT